MTRLFFACCLVVTIIAFAHFTLYDKAFSQELKGRILKRVTYENEPISFTSIKLQGTRTGTQLFFDTEFIAGDYWLREIFFELQNISGKDIAALEVGIVLRIKGRKLPTGLTMNYGSIHEIEKGTLSVPIIKPNGTIALKLTDYMFGVLEKRLKGYDSLSNITKVSVYPSFVLFSDGTMWVAGSILYPDKDTNNKWIPGSFETSLTRGQSQKNISQGFCQCGGPQTQIEVCCQSETCSISYQRNSIVCNGGSWFCCAVEGPWCDCFGGSCLTCFFVNCETGVCI
ncbi:MAG: hypothetical protein IPM55_21780 [Acidobacteria bacterium]|nr:hypothetical protein [Acidobacteriota bacterium]